MNKVLVIDGNLVFPPSSTSCFRDITLYANVFRDVDVIIQIDNTHTDTCYHYLKQHGAFDYVQDILPPLVEDGVILSNTPPYHIRARKLWAGNLQRIVQEIMSRF